MNSAERHMVEQMAASVLSKIAGNGIAWNRETTSGQNPDGSYFWIAPELALPGDVSLRPLEIRFEFQPGKGGFIATVRGQSFLITPIAWQIQQHM